jgi:hypothetical protein
MPKTRYAWDAPTPAPSISMNNKGAYKVVLGGVSTDQMKRPLTSTVCKTAATFWNAPIEFIIAKGANCWVRLVATTKPCWASDVRYAIYSSRTRSTYNGSTRMTRASSPISSPSANPPARISRPVRPVRKEATRAEQVFGVGIHSTTLLTKPNL